VPDPNDPYWAGPADGWVTPPAYGGQGQPPARALAWGYPFDVPGTTVPVEVRRRPWVFPATILATALIAGSVGGYLGSRGAPNAQVPTAAQLRDVNVDLPTVVPVAPVARPQSSVAVIAARVLRSVVSISVESGVQGGTGSGVVLRADGYILTNNHVVASATGKPTITVSFNGDNEIDLPADVVGVDPETDLAVIKVRGARHPLIPATLGSSSGLVVGDPVVAIGSPLGLAGTVTSGIVSALNRTVRVPAEDGSASSTPLFNAIQTDAAINPGNSGGALIDLDGRVIGINSAIATLGSTSTDVQSGSIGVGFAIPVDEARSIAEQLIKTGKATHPAIGVSATTVGADGHGPRGAKLNDVTAGGAAAKAGLQSGDIITRVGDRPVSSVDSLIVDLRAYLVGDSVSVSYLRAGKPHAAQLTLQDKKPS
jgi:putative serine protease PepD